MCWDVQQHHLRMAVAGVFCALICIRRIIMLDAIVIPWVDVMRDANRMYGRLAHWLIGNARWHSTILV
jgi:hypothetical protein